MQPVTQYTKVGDSRIGYQVVGDGPIDLLLLTGASSNVDLRWDEPLNARFLKRMASFSRLILFDRRGSGVSDPVPLDALPTWEEWAEDITAVLDAVGSERTAIFAWLDGGPMAMLFAATYPHRVSALVLGNTTARYLIADDYPGGKTREEVEFATKWIEENWGTEGHTALVLPSQAQNPNFCRWYARYQRASGTPGEVAAYYRLAMNLDIRHVLPSIHTPTLVVGRTNYPLLNLKQMRHLADHIEGARFVPLEGTDGMLSTENPEELLDLVEEFVTGERHERELDRVLATVLFTDIVGSTDRLAELGDRRWRQVLDEHDDLSRQEIEDAGGRFIKSTGDGVLATFDGPGKGIRCAIRVREALRPLGIDIRAGLHTGEVELRNGGVDGIAVHLGARVMSQAGGGEILVSSTVKDLVAGAGITFSDRGLHALKGVPERWHLFVVEETP